MSLYTARALSFVSWFTLSRGRFARLFLGASSFRVHESHWSDWNESNPVGESARFFSSECTPLGVGGLLVCACRNLMHGGSLTVSATWWRTRARPRSARRRHKTCCSIAKVGMKSCACVRNTPVDDACCYIQGALSTSMLVTESPQIMGHWHDFWCCFVNPPPSASPRFLCFYVGKAHHGPKSVLRSY